ncbi:MAG: leucine-rich repeat domain-containing protein [Flavobacterium sp.]|nr:leucine-rich repeat domain-containing protein [Flavobacterium sp.]
MKTILLLLLLFTGMAKAQIVSIPDPNFKAKLISLGIDSNNSGEIDTFETTFVSDLHLENSNINNLIGIGAFTNLNILYCDSNNLTFLDLSDNVNLTFLSCRVNQIPYLDLSNSPNLTDVLADSNALNGINISNNPSLEMLWVADNNLTTLDTSSCVNLTQLWCSNNNLTSLNLTSSSNLARLLCESNQLANINLTGLNNLYQIDCSFNQLSSLNASALPALKFLNCASNLLPSLNVSGLTNLITLACDFNQIPALNVTGLTNLERISCRHNQLTALDLTGLTNLTELDFDSNQIASIDVSNLPNLVKLYCGSNLLTTLDVAGLTDLYQLNCEFNQLTTIDVSTCISLQNFYCDNNLLTTLFIKNGKVENIGLNNNPNLLYICADEEQVSGIQTLAFSNNPNIVVSSYCSFVPGGNYNSVTGTARFDLDNNGCDTNDFFANSVRLDITDGSTPSATFLNASGNYTLYTAIGNYTLSTSIENPSYFTISPESSQLNFVSLDNTVVTQDFCITANGVYPDLEIVIAPITPARPGFDAKYQIVYHNKGNQVLSGNITFTYNDAVLDFVSATVAPDTQTLGLLNWNYSDLLPFENRSFYVILNVNSPLEIPAVNIGDILNYEATITPVIGDDIPADNLFTFNQTVIGSFDPNDITCIEGDSVPSSEIGNYLHYVINFENTGTYPAENVVVKTEVDATKFDISSLQLMNSNFPVNARITGNKVEFIFENIQLPIGGHGHILLKVKTRNSLVSGDAVANRGDIFFDYNAPVDTGFANTVFEALLGNSVVNDEIVSIYPNPTSSMINIKSDAEVQSISLLDIKGRVLSSQKVGTKQIAIDLTGKAKGIYFLKLVTAKGISIKKVMKE